MHKHLNKQTPEQEVTDNLKNIYLRNIFSQLAVYDSWDYMKVVEDNWILENNFHSMSHSLQNKNHTKQTGLEYGTKLHPPAAEVTVA